MSDGLTATEALKALSPTLGDAGARMAIVNECRRSALKAKADQFEATGPFRLPDWPERAHDVELPHTFWVPAFADSGEREFRGPTGDIEAATRADWRSGNFISTTFFHGPHAPRIVRASGVRFSRDGIQQLAGRPETQGEPKPSPREFLRQRPDITAAEDLYRAMRGRYQSRAPSRARCRDVFAAERNPERHRGPGAIQRNSAEK